ncbi:hypothetical protein E2P64_05020 [Candidatus Bathyarchaeota archaeon]|jgi:hypothetical protein|nr:hypothetical protein E2P64_05020 [Candidatus Bathyarchaeota archaeon]
MKKWRKVEIAQTVLSILIIFSIIIISAYSVWPNFFKHNSSEAVKLVISGPPSNTITIGQPQIITVYATNTNGQIDESRNDIIELIINPPNSATILNSTRTNLRNGKATFIVVINQSEIVIFTANWIAGRTPLESAMVSYNLMEF